MDATRNVCLQILSLIAPRSHLEARVGRSALSDCPEKASRPPLRRCVVCDPSKNQQLAYACPTYPGRRREEVDREVGGGDCAEA
jgi:hypothetical protein